MSCCMSCNMHNRRPKFRRFTGMLHATCMYSECIPNVHVLACNMRPVLCLKKVRKRSETGGTLL